MNEQYIVASSDMDIAPPNDAIIKIWQNTVQHCSGTQKKCAFPQVLH